jgi:hypothetical protein
VLDNLCFWTEQYLLQAFLLSNREFEVIWGSSAMQLLPSRGPHRRISKLALQLRPAASDRAAVYPYFGP